jgi:hypothetical protein
VLILPRMGGTDDAKPQRRHHTAQLRVAVERETAQRIKGSPLWFGCRVAHTGVVARAPSSLGATESLRFRLALAAGVSIMRHPTWNGTELEAECLLEAIAHNCTCEYGPTGARLRVCGAHRLLVDDQRARWMVCCSPGESHRRCDVRSMRFTRDPWIATTVSRPTGRGIHTRNRRQARVSQDHDDATRRHRKPPAPGGRSCTR